MSVAGRWVAPRWTRSIWWESRKMAGLVVGAARQRLGIEAVAGILDGALSLESALPILLEGAEAPVQLAAPAAAGGRRGDRWGGGMRAGPSGTRYDLLRHREAVFRPHASGARNRPERAPVLEESPVAAAPLDATDTPETSERADARRRIGSRRAFQPRPFPGRPRSPSEREPRSHWKGRGAAARR